MSIHSTLQLLSFISTLKSFGGVMLAVAILLAMVTIHEFGHYLAGKILGFKINEFSVGFGPAIFKKRSKKTGELFALRVIPLGGYCAFDGEDDESIPSVQGKSGKSEAEPPQPFAELNMPLESTETQNAPTMYEANANDAQALSQPNEGDTTAETADEAYPQPKGARFNDQKPWKRIIVLLAGATMNYLLALGIILLMFATIGRPVYKVSERMSLDKLDPQSTSEEKVSDDLLVNDVIMEIEGKSVYMITDYLDVLDGKSAGDEISLTVLRDGEQKQIKIKLYKDADFVNMSDVSGLLYSLGVQSMYAVTQREGFFETIGSSFAYSWKIGGTVLRSLGELLTGKIGLESMGGPITTIKVTSEAASSSLLSFLNIAAFIGVNLAVFNLLPIPALDGCKVIFCIIEWIRKKPVNRKVEAAIHFAGIIFLFGFAILVDLLQLF